LGRKRRHHQRQRTLYAPANVAAQQSATITATSQVDNTKTGTATVTLLPPITVSVTPPTATLYGGQSQQFTATVANAANTAVTWTASIGSISADGLYIAPASVSAQQSVTITATSQVDNSKTGTAAVTLLPPITVSVTPATATLYGGQTQQFTATVANAANTAVTWTASIGSISATGLYAAPPSISTQQSVTITATSQVDNSATGTATVTLSPPISVSVTPATCHSVRRPVTAVHRYRRQRRQQRGHLDGQHRQHQRQWSLHRPASISAQQSVTITATSQADNSTTGTATVTLTPPISISVRPRNCLLYGGQSQQFTATVANAANTAVTWTATLGSISATGLYTAPAEHFPAAASHHHCHQPG
jgi:adhesin HecA-like repeat protein